MDISPDKREELEQMIKICDGFIGIGIQKQKAINLEGEHVDRFSLVAVYMGELSVLDKVFMLESMKDIELQKARKGQARREF